MFLEDFNIDNYDDSFLLSVEEYVKNNSGKPLIEMVLDVKIIFDQKCTLPKKFYCSYIVLSFLKNYKIDVNNIDKELRDNFVKMKDENDVYTKYMKYQDAVIKKCLNNRNSENLNELNAVDACVPNHFSAFLNSVLIVARQIEIMIFYFHQQGKKLPKKYKMKRDFDTSLLITKMEKYYDELTK